MPKHDGGAEELVRCFWCDAILNDENLAAPKKDIRDCGIQESIPTLDQCADTEACETRDDDAQRERERRASATTK